MHFNTRCIQRSSVDQAFAERYQGLETAPSVVELQQCAAQLDILLDEACMSSALQLIYDGELTSPAKQQHDWQDWHGSVAEEPVPDGYQETPVIATDEMLALREKYMTPLVFPEKAVGLSEPDRTLLACVQQSNTAVTRH